MKKEAVTCVVMGDAGGIGPELVAKSLRHSDPFDGLKTLILGSREILNMGMRISGTEIKVPTFNNIEQALASDSPVSLLDREDLDYGDITIGENNKRCGEADLGLARYVVELFQNGLIDGLVFAPVNKISLKMGGSAFEGYKAYIANLLGLTRTSEEINTIGHLWTTRVTSHMAISEVAQHITEQNVYKVIQYFNEELRKFGYENPKIAVSGLNPHNGDNGMFGREEIDEIGPAVERAKRTGVNVEGPYPADTIFLKVKKEGIPGVVSMFHDQCQIATKLMGFDEGVTYFGGLPFPIMTPAHGTAFDIAGKGVASERPLLNALSLMRKAVLKKTN